MSDHALRWLRTMVDDDGYQLSMVVEYGGLNLILISMVVKDSG